MAPVSGACVIGLTHHILLPEMLLSTVQFHLKIELHTNDEYLRIHLKTYELSYETFLNVTFY